MRMMPKCSGRSVVDLVKWGAWVSLLVTAAAVPARAGSLEEMYRLAKDGDPRYRMARLEAEAAGFGVDEARAGLLPVVAASVTRDQTSQNILSSDNAVFSKGSASYPTDVTALTLTQPIYRHAAWKRFDQSKAAAKQAGLSLAVAEQELMLRVATAYVGVLAARDGLSLAEAERESIKRQYDLAESRYRSGQATVVGLRDAEARRALKESDVVAAQNELADRRQALAEIIGRPADGLVPVAPSALPGPPQPADLDEWVRRSVERNLAVEMRRQAVEVARLEVERQKAGHWPTLDLALTTERRNTGGSLFGGGSDVRQSVVQVRLNVPLYEGGQTTAATNIAVRRHEIAKEDLAREQRQVERQARAAYLGVTGGLTRVKAFEQSTVALESARQLKTEGYRAGLVTVLAVLDAERDLFAARRDAAQSRYDLLLNTLRLKQAAGTLSEDDLARLTGAVR